MKKNISLYSTEDTVWVDSYSDLVPSANKKLQMAETQFIHLHAQKAEFSFKEAEASIQVLLK